MSPLVDFVKLGLSAAEQLANQSGIDALRNQLGAYGLAAGGFEAANQDNAVAAVVGVMAGTALAVGVVTVGAPTISAAAAAVAAYYGWSAVTTAAFEIGLLTALQAGIEAGGAYLTTGTINSLSSVMGTAPSWSAISQALAADGQVQAESAQLEMQGLQQVWDAAGQGLSAIGQSLWQFLQQGNYELNGLVSVAPDGNGNQDITLAQPDAAGVCSQINLVLDQTNQVASEAARLVSGGAITQAWDTQNTALEQLHAILQSSEPRNATDNHLR